MSPGAEGEHRVFRVGGISYLRIPAEDPQRSAAFYGAVFSWNVRMDREDPAFEDGTGHDLWVATIRDPSGNVIGVWQQGPRGSG